MSFPYPYHSNPKVPTFQRSKRCQETLQTSTTSHPEIGFLRRSHSSRPQSALAIRCVQWAGHLTHT